MMTKTIQYDGRNTALKQVLELFTTLGGRILDDESPYDKEFVKKVRRAEKSKKHEIDIDKIWE
ncbi:MAG: hypothetical protein IKQ09_00530 [Bacteroidales bacterium]|nr:hypothetical protein [Bacteroidales bacterium]